MLIDAVYQVAPPEFITDEASEMALTSKEPENVILKCNLATTPAVFVPEDNLNSFTYLVMPVQVRS